MIGITAYGAYIPLYRLGKGTEGWTAPTERAIANFDEDSITMAVAAALDCLKGIDPKGIDGLYFASTSSPYKEKQASTLIATAADLREDILTADFGNTLRAGTIALKAALDAVKAGTAKKIMVAIADLRVPQPRSEYDYSFGDGAAAFIVGGEGVIAEIEDYYSISHEILDLWRSDGDTFVRSWEDRFVLDEGYFEVMQEAGSNMLKKHNLTPKDLNKVVIYAPNLRRHIEITRRLGFDEKTQLVPSFFGQMGDTGCAFAPMMLIAALEEAKAGERILMLNYGQGAEAFIMRVTEDIDKVKDRRGIKGHLASKRILPEYQTYLRWRGLVDIAHIARRPPLKIPSASAIHRERDQNIRLYGVKCRRCGTPQYPIERICTICQAKDEFEPYRFTDKRATLFTYAMDYLGLTIDPPLVISIIDFAGGGRMICTMTDRDIKEIKIGMPLEMSFRKLHTVEGIHNYFWKAIPVRT